MLTVVRSEAAPSRSLLPSDEPLCLLSADGRWTTATTAAGPTGTSVSLDPPTDPELLTLHRAMVIGRRFDAQAAALVKQGRMAVYPSSRGQDACQVGSVLALADQDWLFPTYRDSVAVVTRGVDPVEVLTLLRGDWHCGYDPYQHRVAPQCTPLATNELHAVGLAHAAALQGQDTVALVLLGDGATSEGDTHEALNFAAVWKAPVVFLIQNNGYAISVPLAKQSAAPSLAHKGIGYGIPSLLIDGNDAAAVYSAVKASVARARGGAGPTLIEAITYRMDAHTNADDATRYRSADEVRSWAARDPILRLERHLQSCGLLDEARLQTVHADAAAFASSVRVQMNSDVHPDPQDLFRFVYAEPTPSLLAQSRFLTAESAAGEGDDEAMGTTAGTELLEVQRG